jgi:hypothetical protein
MSKFVQISGATPLSIMTLNQKPFCITIKMQLSTYTTLRITPFSIFMLNVFLLAAFVPNAVQLSVIVLNVVVLSVMVPYQNPILQKYSSFKLWPHQEKIL